MARFIKENLVFVPNRKNKPSVLLPKSDLVETFQKFESEHNGKEINFRSKQSILKEFSLTVENLIPKQKKNIRDGRRPGFRGYYCLAFKKRLVSELKTSKEKYFSFDQIKDVEELQFYQDENVLALLNQNPFSFSGVITNSENDSVFVKTNETSGITKKIL